MMNLTKILFENIICSYGYEGGKLIKGCKIERLELSPNKVYALSGDNGSGKSTFLKALIGQVPIISGNVDFHFDHQLEGKQAIDIKRFKNNFNIFYMPQNVSSMFPSNTCVRTVINMWSKLGGKTKSETEAILKSIGLKEHLIDSIEYNHCANISGGQAQFLGIALCFLQKPDIILLDEPSAAISNENRSIIIDLIKKLKEVNRYIIMTTHDNALKGMADEVKEISLATSAFV